jgi:hypothetical protein
MVATLATLTHLIGTGHLAPGTDNTVPMGARADTLLELAEGLVLSYIGTTASTVADDWSAASKLAIAATITEVAGRRLTSPGAETAEQLGDQPGYLRVRLTKADKADLDEIAEVKAARATSKPTSLQVTRPNSWANTIGTTTEDDFS